MKNKDRERRISEFPNIISYVFSDQRLLRQALVHSSFVHENKGQGLLSNERMEYLGDAVLNLVVGEFLYRNCPRTPEGELSRIRAAIVCETTLSIISKGLGLGDCLQFGQGEERSGGATRPSILADGLEALIGGIFLDGGYEAARRFILLHFKDALDEAQNGDLFSDYKTVLQERIQRRKSGLLSYILLDESGPDHDKLFSVGVFIDDVQIGDGLGRSKKEAEQLAAKKGLLWLEKE